MAKSDDLKNERARVARLQLVFAGWLPTPDNEPVESDDWHTPPELVNEIAEFFGGSIDLDPCWSPLSFVRPRVAYVDPATSLERLASLAGVVFSAPDGLKQPWVGESVRSRFVNPPYSQPAPWIRRLAELHAGTPAEIAGESIALVRIDTSTMWWQLAWEASAICWLRFRVPFVHPGRALRSQPRDHHALIYWGQHAQAFCESWEWLGHCERPGRAHEPTADELCAQLVELGHLRIVDGNFALVPESFAEEDARREHKLLKIDGIPMESYPFLPGSSVEDLNAIDEANPIEQVGRDCARSGKPIRSHGWCDDCHLTPRGEPSCANCYVTTCAKVLADAEADTLVDEPALERTPIAENPRAWPAVTPTVHCTCPAPGCPKHGGAA